MDDALKAKINNLMEAGIDSECEVVYFLVEVRKLMERDGEEPNPFETLKLYSDWAVHTRLAGPQAQRIVKLADAVCPKMRDGTLTSEDKNELKKVFLFHSLREELEQFLKEKLYRWFDDKEWNTFLKFLLLVLEDCPLICKPDNAVLKNVDEVIVIKDAAGPATTATEIAPEVAWGLCYKGTFLFPIGANSNLSDSVVDAYIEFGRSRAR